MYIFNKLINKLKKNFDYIRLRLNRRSHVEEDVLVGLDINLEHLYDDPEVAKEVHERYIGNIKQVDLLKNKYKQLVNEITLLQRIEALEAKTKKGLEKLCQIYSETLIKRGEYKNEIETGINLKNDYIEEYNKDMDKIIKMMKSHEKSQRAVKQDMAYLEAEKSDLLYQSRRLKKAFIFVKSALVMVAFLTAIIAFILSIMIFVYDQDVLLIAMVSMIIVIVISVWIYVFRRYLVYEITKNQKLMKRAIEIINKTKIKYINNQKVINYQCRKYKVDGSEMLELRWDNYKERIRTENKFRNISNSIAAIMTDIEDLLLKKGIKESEFIFDHIDYFISKKGRKILFEKLNSKKEENFTTLKQTERENDIMNLVLTNYKSYTSQMKKQA